MNQSVTIVLQARTGSTRLPSKVLKPLLGKPMLARMLERIKRASTANIIIVATSDKTTDDPVATLAKESQVSMFRGSEEDVLDRYYHAAKEAQADVIVRVTGDCPLHDPQIIDLVVNRYRKENVDYISGPENYPEGLDTEVFSFNALEKSWHEARLPSEREHVTLYIRNHPELFTVSPSWAEGDVDGTHMHWSVDTEADFRFVEEVYEYLYKNNPAFGMNDVLVLLKTHPELRELNKGGTGFEGLEKSLKEDEEWKKHHA